MADAQLFSLQLKAFADKAKANATTVVRRTALSLGSNVVMRTPVGDPKLWKHKPPKGYVGGRLRANWMPSLDAPDLTTIDIIDPSGAVPITALKTVLDGYAGQDIYIMNNLPYAVPVEYGHSSQAPAGMVRISVAEAQVFVDEAVASLKV